MLKTNFPQLEQYFSECAQLVTYINSSWVLSMEQEKMGGEEGRRAGGRERRNEGRQAPQEDFLAFKGKPVHFSYSLVFGPG